MKDLIIKPNKFIVFRLSYYDTLKLDNRVEFMFGGTFGLQVYDEKSQVSGLDEKYLQYYEVPNEN